jgi:acyl carrier protein
VNISEKISNKKMKKLNDSQKEKVKEILADKLVLSPSLDQITDDSDLFNDLGADSLDAIEIVMELEKEFNCYIDDQLIEKFRTVNDVYVALENSL